MTIRPSPAEEHALELADRLMRFADLVGRMMAAVDAFDAKFCKYRVEEHEAKERLRKEVDRMVMEVLRRDGEGEREPTEESKP